MMAGGIDHVSHRLSRFGFGTLGTPLMLALVAGGLGMTAVFVMQASLIEGYAMGAAVLVLSCLALWQLEWRFPPETSSSM